MRVLFLDIDGVLNSAEWLHLIRRMEGFGWKKPDPELPKFRISHLDPVKVDMLVEVIKKLNLTVVLTSTWRMNKTVTETNEFFSKFGISIFDHTPITFKGDYARGHEIQQWLDSTSEIVEDFVILDDDSDMVHLIPHLIQTNWEHGLSSRYIHLIELKFQGLTSQISEYMFW